MLTSLTMAFVLLLSSSVSVETNGGTPITQESYSDALQGQACSPTAQEKAELEHWLQEAPDTKTAPEPTEEVIVPPEISTPPEVEKEPIHEEELLASQVPNATLAAIIDEGKIIVLDSQERYIVPPLLQQITSQWKAGDLLIIEQTKRKQWIKITNLLSHETILAKYEPEEEKK